MKFRFKILEQKDVLNEATYFEVQNIVNHLIGAKDGRRDRGNGDVTRKIRAYLMYKEAKDEAQEEMIAKLKKKYDKLKQQEDIYVLHHMDGDHYNNDINNLCITKSTIHNNILNLVSNFVINKCKNSIKGDKVSDVDIYDFIIQYINDKDNNKSTMIDTGWKQDIINELESSTIKDEIKKFIIQKTEEQADKPPFNFNHIKCLPLKNLNDVQKNYIYNNIIPPRMKKTK